MMVTDFRAITLPALRMVILALPTGRPRKYAWPFALLMIFLKW